MFPFSDKPLLPGSQVPWALWFSSKFLLLALLCGRHLPKSRTSDGEHLHMVYIPYTIDHFSSLHTFRLYTLDNKLSPHRNSNFMWVLFSSKIPLLQINNGKPKPSTLTWGNLISEKNKAGLAIKLSVSTTDINYMFISDGTDGTSWKYDVVVNSLVCCTSDATLIPL